MQWPVPSRHVGKRMRQSFQRNILSCFHFKFPRHIQLDGQVMNSTFLCARACPMHVILHDTGTGEFGVLLRGLQWRYGFVQEVVPRSMQILPKTRFHQR